MENKKLTLKLFLTPRKKMSIRKKEKNKERRRDEKIALTLLSLHVEKKAQMNNKQARN
jgi:hypothetical protein